MLLDDLQTYLAAFDPATFTASSTAFAIRKYFSPETPDACVTLIATPGYPDVRGMGASLAAPLLERAGLQVVTRGPKHDYAAAQTVAEAVHAKLNFLTNWTGASGATYHLIKALSTPFLMDSDRENRWRVVCNYIVTKTRG